MIGGDWLLLTNLIFEEAGILIFAIINNHINRSSSRREMSAQPNSQISNTAFPQTKTTEASIISNHLRTSVNTSNLHDRQLQQDYMLKPPSIFCHQEQSGTLDRYFKIRMFDKPKDTLAQIVSKKEQFQRYITRASNQQAETSRKPNQYNNHYQDTSRKIFSEHTFTENVALQTILAIMVTPSVGNKCNIVVANLRGQIIKYYPSVLFRKKGGKILKILQQFQNNCFYISDACFKQINTKYFVPFFRDKFCFCYSFALNQQLESLEFIQAQELKQKFGANVIIFEKNVKLVNLRPEYLILQSILDKVELIINKKWQQLNNFLVQFRGGKSQADRNLTFDLIAVNINKQFGCQSEIVANKINQLFDKKVENITIMIPQQKHTNIHLPFKTQKEQNCALCLYKNLNKAKPKRTFWICQVCSSQKEMPIYLCKKCFGEYHENPDIYIFKKNEKKTRRALKIKRKMVQNNQSKHNNTKNESEVKEQALETCQQNEKTLLVNRLNKLQEEFFDKIGSIIEEGQDNNLKSCTFYLSMLLNTNLQFAKKINEQWRERNQQL